MIELVDGYHATVSSLRSPQEMGVGAREQNLNSQSAQPISFDSSISQKPQQITHPSKSSDVGDEQAGSQSNAHNPQRSLEAEQKQLEREVRQVVEQLRARDREVRAHEMAHIAAAGTYARGGMSLSYQRGPDGQQYAIGGSVQIDTSPIPGDPEATLQKARVVQQAALAPAEPSNQDRKVASAASQMMANAMAEIRMQAEAERKAAMEEASPDEDDASVSGKSDTDKSEDSNDSFRVIGSGKSEPMFTNSEPVANDLGVQASAAQSARMHFDARVQVMAH